jgi:hypothetical protein
MDGSVFLAVVSFMLLILYLLCFRRRNVANVLLSFMALLLMTSVLVAHWNDMLASVGFPSQQPAHVAVAAQRKTTTSRKAVTATAPGQSSSSPESLFDPKETSSYIPSAALLFLVLCLFLLEVRRYRQLTWGQRYALRKVPRGAKQVCSRCRGHGPLRLCNYYDQRNWLTGLLCEGCATQMHAQPAGQQEDQTTWSY